MWREPKVIQINDRSRNEETKMIICTLQPAALSFYPHVFYPILPWCLSWCNCLLQVCIVLVLWIFRHPVVEQTGHRRFPHLMPPIRYLLPASRITRIITKVLSLLPLFSLPFPLPPRPLLRPLRPPLKRPATVPLRQIMRIIIKLTNLLGPVIDAAEAVVQVGTAVIGPNECQRPLAVEVLVLCQKCPSAVWICWDMLP